MRLIQRVGEISAGERRYARRWSAACILGGVALLLAMASAAPAGAVGTTTGTGRIAVTGIHPTGYVGLLARNGLSRDILLDYQLSDPALLSRYDLIIVAGATPAMIGRQRPAPGGSAGNSGLDALTHYVAQGGSLLLDYSGASPPLMAWLTGRSARLPAGASGLRTTARFRLAAGDNPLLSEVGQNESFPPASISYVPVPLDPERSVVLAEFLRPTGKIPQRQARRAANQQQEVQAPAGSPAILLEPLGKGKIIHSGVSIGLGIALAGIDYDRLVMAMIRELTGGRATPQLTPEGTRLRRKQSSRSVGDDSAEPADEEAPALAIPERPDGPGTRGALPKGFSLAEEDPATEYNLHGHLQGSQAEVLLNYWSGADHLRVIIASSGIRVIQVSAGRARGLCHTKAEIVRGTPVVIKERRHRLIVIAGPASATASISDLHRGSIALRGALGEVRYQPVEPPLFSDDFMRTSDEPGGWETHGGTWQTAPVQNPDMGANPFSYKVRAEAEPATAIAGYPYWDEYRLTASLRPETASGHVGMGFYVQDPQNMLLFRARILEGGAPHADGFALIRLVDGREQVLAQRPGGLRPSQWYRVQVKAEGPWIGAFVDGERLLAVRETTFSGGQIALRAVQTAARFDDVLVEPVTLPLDTGQRLVGTVPAWAGIIDVDSWAGPATPWEAHPEVPGLFWRRGVFYGDVGMRFEIPELPPGGQAMLLADGDGESVQSGYSLTLSRSETTTSLVLAQGGKVLARSTLLNAGPFALSLRKQGTRVLGLVDDKVVVKAPATEPAGAGRLAFWAVGFKPRISSIAVWSANISDYTFDTAPVDWWVASGEWDITNRWSCTPDWSWFGGFSADVAAIWHKRAFEGNIALDFYAGPKMITLDGRKKEAMADFNAALCSDGTNINSGYAFLVAEKGVGARILKQGQVVAENRAFRLFSHGHNRWANIRVEKHNGRLRLFVEGQLAVEYTDPEPLSGGYAGIWTQNNGIMVPRVTLYYEAPGERLLSLPWQG